MQRAQWLQVHALRGHATGVEFSILHQDTTPGHLLRVSQQEFNLRWSLDLRYSVTGPQFAVITTLEATSPIDQSTLGVTAALDKATLADIIKRLTHRGWIIQARDDRDRRRSLLSLSVEGREALTEITPLVGRLQDALMERIPKPRRESFIERLRRVAFEGLPSASESVPTPSGLLRTPGHLIRRAQRVHTTIWSETVPGDVTGPQYSVLAAIAAADEGGADARTIGRASSLDRSTVAEVIGRLERDGWIVRRTDDRDRRRFQIALAAPTELAMEHLTARAAAVQHRLFAPLDPAEAEETIEDLASLSGRRVDASAVS